jgi:hypothetical protein
MKMRWSKLYPKSWQLEFGEGFDSLNESRPVGLWEAADIIVHAFGARVLGLARSAPMWISFVVVAWLNIFAREVQWPAGALLIGCAIAAFRSPRKWWSSFLLLFLAIPISSLYFYQIPGIHHEPLYKTAVALLPALAGAVFGAALRIVSRPPTRGVAL